MSRALDLDAYSAHFSLDLIEHHRRRILAEGFSKNLSLVNSPVQSYIYAVCGAGGKILQSFRQWHLAHTEELRDEEKRLTVFQVASENRAE
jgi:hypothetical protein